MVLFKISWHSKINFWALCSVQLSYATLFLTILYCHPHLFFVFLIAWLLRTFCGSFLEILKMFFFSISMKNDGRVLIASTLNLQITLGSMNILTLLILLFMAMNNNIPKIK